MKAARIPPATARGVARTLAAILAGALVLIAGLYLFHRLEQFLIRDPRFALGGPQSTVPGSTAEDDSLLLSGAAHASHRAIQGVFDGDYGRSVYLVPIEGRRATLQTVDWVKDASVARVWPNRLVVQVVERKPVAFVALASGRVALIDEDGVILPPTRDRFTLPVLTGVRAADPLSERRERVGRLLHLLQDLGEEGKKISEVDVSDRDNLKVSQPWDGRVVTLLLGDRNFPVRYRNFLNHFAEIRRKLPGASTLDLRLEDRITVVE